VSLGPRGKGWLATSLLAALGAVTGAAVGAALTLCSSLLFGLPRLPGTEYFLYNMTSFAGLGAVSAPLIAWLGLRRVPLWRAVLEPASVVLVAGLITIGLGVFLPIMALPTVALFASAWRLRRAYAPSRDTLPPADATRQVLP
jgi:hypothetical protein